MADKKPLFEFTAKRATFRIADTKPPMEEVSVTGRGRFKGEEFVTLYTVKVRSGGDDPEDRISGPGIMTLDEGRGRAAYRIRGGALGGPKFSEVVSGTIVFGSDCTGKLKELRNLKTYFETAVDPKGDSRTKVWRIRPPR